MTMRSFVQTALLCCAGTFSLAMAEAREVSGVTLPETVMEDGSTLKLNGMGVRTEKILFKAYVIALYLAEPASDANVAIRTDETKRLVFTLLRNISHQAFVDAIEAGMIRNSKAEMPTLRARLDLLEQAVPDLTKGEEIDLTWLPGSGTLLRCQGKTMLIPGKDFADAVLGVWLGPNPVESGLKRLLLGL
jgi:hypothetical protein